MDIDGTLTPPGGYEPSERVLRAVRKARANGHKVFLCSGRNYGMMAPLLRFGFDGGISSCGAHVFVGDNVLYDCPMTEEQKDTIMRIYAENGVSLTVECLEDAYCDEAARRFLTGSAHEDREVLRMIKAVWVDLGAKPMEIYDGSPVYKMVFVFSRDDQIADARAAFEDGLKFIIHDFSEPDIRFGEIINLRSDKGSGVRLITEHLGYDIADTIGIGDSMLDLGMIETVGTGVCMEDGSPTLKKMSDLICPSVYDDGAAWVFERLGLI